MEVSKGNLAVVYSHISEQKVQTAESVLGSILAQLSQQDNRGFDMPQTIKDAYMNRFHFWLTKPTLKELQKWLYQRLQAGPRVFVLLEALDEMDSKSRRSLLRSLQMQFAHQNFRLMVTSRNIPEIGAELGSYEEVEIRAAATDLEALVLARLSEEASENLREQILGSTEEKVVDKILSKIDDSAGDM